MPVIKPSSYHPPYYLHSGHFQTIFPTLFRHVPVLTPERERIETPDHDFIDIDWAREAAGHKLAIISHGLEGHSRSQYCQGMAQSLINDGWHVCIWNFRGCSGEPNRLLQSYHSGATEDLHTVIEHANRSGTYDQMALIGFSLGGNLTLKYVAESGLALPPFIRAAVGISVACDLESCATKLESWDNRIYMHRFLKSLTRKVRYNMQRFPGAIKDEGLSRMRTFRQFDDAYTAPIHGFKDAHHYWSQCSCGPMLKNLSIPTFLINAQNDPFLTAKCFPYEAAEHNKYLHFEAPKQGGHIGFLHSLSSKTTYAEERALEFLRNKIK